ncbi:hypothetical protein TNCV_3221411 [Trichonephila clavipes]|nr:hypothetical protein TNCV_3221411 [Trichonephila clavipes]
MCVFLEALWVSAVPFHGRQCTMSSHSSCRTAHRVRILNVWIGRHDLGSQSHRACLGFFLRQTLGSSYLTTSNLIQGFDWRCKTNGQQPQQLIDTSFSAWADAVETCLAVRGDHIPY